ncbi:MAG: lipoprotein-releasing system ATP-binding protein LolD [Zetaproteobacteria bacterium CG06_land_8_20_14_3_00_59_53]|nr:MAG: lipoprotein ABC transporter ATP-binding protein [Zetaproteobacteria bacterium CG2_30_59_37]PIO88905.1 MAG: lipoprotein-releasing system ATP-binding protein LolD [Zetaproteobacteria bacterium CG23_combo_of_CG06-09_8_20_14_all_59_86]PIQ65209.1 MAG: lipoprotein-releasing system ATP-binding protein LolD [Zetaproteobacteria bacterium CG11_big_fil_rev_8_21_14_0_20_59_439]PIU70787.1 MAG: lipoprotein-releasing system ATP-binding protein LolD [Zetaproteobacteria bacterium CG06_land_8_20_14_3_00_5
MSEPSGASAALLQVSGLKKTFASPGGDIRVLDGVDMQVAEREFVAIVGQSGSGKSTLLHILGTLESADEGEVRLDGESMFGLSPADMAALRNRSIGFVYQAHHLIPELSALENVMMPLLVRGESRENAAERAVNLLGRMGLSDRTSHRPGKLSGGEAQRVAVARSLVGKPRLLLADEPTGNLDERTAEDVFLAMRQLCREEYASAIMVTHSRILADACDRQLLLHDGIIAS